jgi:hypothetical protein
LLIALLLIVGIIVIFIIDKRDVKIVSNQKLFDSIITLVAIFSLFITVIAAFRVERFHNTLNEQLDNLTKISDNLSSISANKDFNNSNSCRFNLIRG